VLDLDLHIAQSLIGDFSMFVDTNSDCTNRIDVLKSMGVTAAGRYYRNQRHPEWKVSKTEAQKLSANKIKLFMVFEDFGYAKDLKLTKTQGQADGESALAQARDIGQPSGGVIYFAVEGLPNGYKTKDLPVIRDYFAGVKAAIGSEYRLGVYGDGIVCKTLLDEGICSKTWLAAASTSFEGTVDFYASGRWNLAQTKLELQEDDDSWQGLSVDLDEAKGDFGAFLVPVSTS
jgi:hypothetical protein